MFPSEAKEYIINRNQFPLLLMKQKISWTLFNRSVLTGARISQNPDSSIDDKGKNLRETYSKQMKWPDFWAAITVDFS